MLYYFSNLITDKSLIIGFMHCLNAFDIAGWVTRRTSSFSNSFAPAIETVKKEFAEKKKLFTGKMNLELKKRIMRCLV